MNLPGAGQARVERATLADYVLSHDHPLGHEKANVFRRFGFRLENLPALADAFAEHARSRDVATTVKTRYGAKYTVEGPLQTPDGRNPGVGTVWCIEQGTDVPRFVTAYPLTGVS